MDRRLFLTSTMTSGMIAATTSGTAVAAAAAALDPAGLTKGTIPTPALGVDLDAFEANIKKMAEHCAQPSCVFRPHPKTHKCPAIAQRQMEAGALGICA